MQEKIMQVFYGNDRLPYKDKAREVHYPNVGNIITGENNTTLIRFYVDKIGGISNVSWCANIKTPSGRVFWRLLDETKATDEIGEYVELSISDLYSNEIGKTFISLNGFFGNVEITMNDDEDYEVNGTPDILATGCILVMVNYTPQALYNESLEPSVVQQLIGALGNKLDIYGNMSITKYDSLASAEADLSKIVDGQVILVKVGDYYQYKIKSGGSLTDIATQQASQITIGGIYNSKEDLPSPSEETSGKIYLVRATTKTSDNIYNEYITIYDSETYQWEQAGVNVDDLYPSFSILRTLPTVNINGKSLGSIWSAPFTSGDNPYFTIKYDNRNISKETAISWLRFATGIETLPTFNEDTPKQVYITFVAQQDYGNPVVVYNGDLVITKVQWEQSGDEYGQLKLYIVKTIGSRYHDLTILGSGTYGGVTLRSGNGHDIDIVNNETGNKIAIYRANQSRLICFDDIAPNTDNIISLGVYDSETPANNKGYKNVVSNNFVLGSKWLIKKDASGNLTFQSLDNGEELFKLTSSGYVYTRGLVPNGNKNRPLGSDGAEFQHLWTPILKTKDGGVEYTIPVKDIATSQNVSNALQEAKDYTDQQIAGVTGVTHMYQHYIYYEEHGEHHELRVSLSIVNNSSIPFNENTLISYLSVQNAPTYFNASGVRNEGGSIFVINALGKATGSSIPKAFCFENNISYSIVGGGVVVDRVVQIY